MAGLFDLHVHAGPDVAPRWGGDVATASAYAEADAAGLVLKGHCEPTVGRAAAAQAAVDDRLSVYGGVVCNTPAGGINPAAVEAALLAGGRVVWFPTVDAAAHRATGLTHPPPCAPTSGGEQGIELAANEAPARRVLELIASADAVVATGHVAADEAAWLVRAAGEAGVRRVLLTHPAFVVPAMAAPAVRELCELGALAEVTAYQLRSAPRGGAAALAAFVRAVGIEHCVLTSDAGQADSPSPPEVLGWLCDELITAGLDPGAVRAAAGERPARLVEP